MENIKMVALNFLLENNVLALPIDVISLTSRNKKWHIGSYVENLDIIRLLKLENVCREKRACSVKTVDGEYFILYDHTLSYGERNLYIAHEMGHILLGHNAIGYVLGKSNERSTEDLQEAESNIFALYLVAPACVLIDASIESIRDIVACTRVSSDFAKEISYEISLLKSYAQTSDEKRLCKQFKVYIRKRRMHKSVKLLKQIFLCVLSSIIAALMTYILTVNNYNNTKTANEQRPEMEAYATPTSEEIQLGDCNR